MAMESRIGFYVIIVIGPSSGNAHYRVGISIHPVYRKVLDIQGVMLTSRFQNTFIAVKLIIQGHEN